MENNSLTQPLYTYNGQTYIQTKAPSNWLQYQTNTPRVFTEENGNISHGGGSYKPYNGSLGQQQQTRPQTPYTPNAFTQAQLAQFSNGQRGNFENNPAYQQYVAKMNNMYGVNPVGAAGDVLNGQTVFNAGIGGKNAPTTGGSNG